LEACVTESEMKRIDYSCDLCKKAINEETRMISTTAGDFHEHCIFDRMLLIMRSRSVKEALGIFQLGLKCTSNELMFGDPEKLLTLHQMMDRCMDTHDEMHRNIAEKDEE